MQISFGAARIITTGYKTDDNLPPIFQQGPVQDAIKAAPANVTVKVSTNTDCATVSLDHETAHHLIPLNTRKAPDQLVAALRFWSKQASQKA